MTRRHGSHRLAVGGLARFAGALVVVMVLTGCGSDNAQPRDARTRESASDAPTGFPIGATYSATFTGEGEEVIKVHYVVVVGGPDKIRLDLDETGYEHMLFVRNGNVMLTHDPEEGIPWKRFEAADEHPDELPAVNDFVLTEGTEPFQSQCRVASGSAQKTIEGRLATKYTCKGDASTGSPAHTLWRDDATGLVLQQKWLHLDSINEHPTVTADTFSTQAPPGAKVDVVGARAKGSGAKAHDFALKRLDGGTVTAADFAGKPVVLAFFASDLAFDIHGEVCPGCRDALLDLQRLTDGETTPAVLAVQGGEEGKPGYPLIPDGVHLPTANDPDFRLQHAYGLYDLFGMVLIDSDGTVVASFTKAPTHAQLLSALAKLT